MKAETTNNRHPAVSQEKIIFGNVFKTWAEPEIERVRSIATGPVSRQMIAHLFPDRSTKSVQTMLAKIRGEMGLTRSFSRVAETGSLMRLPILDPDDPGLDDGQYRRDCQSAARGSALLLERMAACG